MSQGIIFAVIAAVSFGLYSTFQNLGSKYVSPFLGAMIISLAALLSGIIFFIINMKNINSRPDMKGIIFLILAGLFASGIDIFALKAYGSALPASVGGPIIIGGSIAVVAIIGFFLGENVSFLKIVGLSFVIVGAYILTSLTK